MCVHMHVQTTKCRVYTEEGSGEKILKFLFSSITGKYIYACMLLSKYVRMCMYTISAYHTYMYTHTHTQTRFVKGWWWGNWFSLRTHEKKIYTNEIPKYGRN